VRLTFNIPAVERANDVVALCLRRRAREDDAALAEAWELTIAY